MGDPYVAASGGVSSGESDVDPGEPVVVARFNDHPQAHLAVASLETIGVMAMVEPSNASLGVEASLTTRPLGIGVLVASSRAEEALRHLESAVSGNLGAVAARASGPRRHVAVRGDDSRVSHRRSPTFGFVHRRELDGLTEGG